MKPPRCSICGKNFRPQDKNSGGIYFKLTSEEQAKKEERKRKRMVGHPLGYHWLCSDHYPQAIGLKHLHWDEAKPLILKD